MHQLHRGLVRHPGAPAHRWGQPVPSVLLERGLDLGEVAAADAGDLSSPADVLELVGQCSHADAGGDKLLAGVHGISVVERLKIRHLQLTIRGVTWTPFLLPRLSGDLPLDTPNVCFCCSRFHKMHLWGGRRLSHQQ